MAGYQYDYYSAIYAVREKHMRKQQSFQMLMNLNQALTPRPTGQSGSGAIVDPKSGRVYPYFYQMD